MNAPPDASRRSPWAAPDPPSAGDEPGSGLAYLSRATPRAASTDPVPAVGEVGRDCAPSTGLAPVVHGVEPGRAPSTDAAVVHGVEPGRGSPPWPARVGSVEPGRSSSRYADEPDPAVGGVELSGGTPPAGAGPAPGVGRVGVPGLVGGLPAGQVVTWLPDGRWVTPESAVEDDAGPVDAAPADPGEVRRRRGERRIALARIGARLGGWPRRVLVGLLLLAAVVLALRPRPETVAAAPAPPTTDVVVAGRDVAAGTTLTAADLRTVSMPIAVTPAGVARQPSAVIGRIAAGAIRRGEAVTDARVVGPGLTAGLGPGESAAVPVRLADPDSAALVRPGDRVDVLGTPVAPDGTQPAAGDAVDVATGVRVLAVLGGHDAADGVVLVVGTTQQTARRLVGAAARHRLTVSMRSP